MTKPTKSHVRPAKTQITQGIRPVLSESSLCLYGVFEIVFCVIYLSLRMTKPTKSHVRPAKTQICLGSLDGCPGWSESSLGIRPAWSESSLCAQCVAKDQPFFKRTAKTLIRLGGCWGWSESQSLGAQVILFVLSCAGSFYFLFQLVHRWFCSFCHAQAHFISSFSSWGENIVLMHENVVLICLLLRYSKRARASVSFLLVFIIYMLVLLWPTIPGTLLWGFYLLSMPAILASRVGIDKTFADLLFIITCS